MDEAPTKKLSKQMALLSFEDNWDKNINYKYIWTPKFNVWQMPCRKTFVIDQRRNENKEPRILVNL